MGALVQRYGTGLVITAVMLVAFWLLMLVVFPYLGLFEQSFRPLLTVDELAGPKNHYTLSNYYSVIDPASAQDVTFLGLNFRCPIYLWIFLVSIIYSGLVTLIALLLCYPFAYYMAKIMPQKSLATLLLLLVIPLCVSELLRSFALFLLLTLKGPLSQLFIALGLSGNGIKWVDLLGGYFGIVVGLIYTNLLFMLFPLYNSMTSLDNNQIEAAEDLGAPWWRTHLRVIAPHCKPGIASGCVTVFMLSAGSLLVPGLLGSTSSNWFTLSIQERFLGSQDWNTGAAYAFLLMIMCTVFVTLTMKFFKVGLADIAK